MIKTAATERFSAPLSQNCLTLHYLLPWASQSHPASSSLLETVSREILGDGLETPALNRLRWHLHTREDFQEGEGRLFEQIFPEKVPLTSQFPCADSQGVQVTPARGHSLGAGGIQDS